QADALTAERLAAWAMYWDGFAELEARGLARRPALPDDSRHNAHIFYLLLDDKRERDALIAALATEGIEAAFHYVPLHSAPAGRRFGRAIGELPVTDAVSARIIRLPLWPGLGQQRTTRVIDAVNAALGLSAGLPLAAA